MVTNTWKFCVTDGNFDAAMRIAISSRKQNFPTLVQ